MSLELDNLLSDIRRNPHQYVIMDRRIHYTPKRISEEFGIPFSTISGWMNRNLVNVLKHPIINEQKYLELNRETLTRLRLYDAMSKVEHRKSLEEFFKVVKMLNNTEWILQAISLIDDPTVDYDTRYIMIESLKDKLMKSKDIIINSIISSPGSEGTN